jgi:acyl-CoA synthetase (AMP-forming)/AMP-acid ligase II/surface polysaccharide O-acyltransferase-like enzyme
MTIRAVPLIGAGRHPFGDLRAHGDAPALVHADGVLSYADLADRVDQVADALGSTRRLVLLPMGNDVASVVGYLAALQAGCPAIIVPPGRPGAPDSAGLIASRYNVDAVVQAEVHERRAGTAHGLHPDLALLLSTSGSTGSPRLVRLSGENLCSNAASIAEYLELTPDDCGPTALPLHYCYGLSVLNSHLSVGASVALTEASVVDGEFWRLFADAGCTSLAGVPYTFELLERSGFADRALPRLRYVTQAGGRLSPDRIRRLAVLGKRRDWDFYVMYGQTEATARIAYLPPSLAASHPHAVGIAVPGGRLSIEPLDSSSVGELVYEGPNVMLGYSDGPADLARGRTVDRLRTGDMGRWTADGMVEIVGRRDRTAKAFGLRLNLDQIERRLADEARVAASVLCVDERLCVFVSGRVRRTGVADVTAAISGVPAHAVDVARLASIPRTGSGKADTAALEHHARVLGASRRQRPTEPTEPTEPTDQVMALRDEYARLLGRPDAMPDDSFVSLRGDSLSYVELSVRLSERLGRLPAAWPSTSIRDLATRRVDNAERPHRWAPVEMSVLLRAIAIVLVVGTHGNLYSLFGGAHLMLAIAGYNFARFQLADGTRQERFKRGLAAVARIAVPSMAWIGAVALVSGYYDAPTVFFLNGIADHSEWTVQWQFWFVEAMVWTMLALSALAAITTFNRIERRGPFAVAIGAVFVGLAIRYAVVGVEAGPLQRYEPLDVFWCFALGWAVARAERRWQRVLLTVVTPLSVVGFFGQPEREAIVAGGILLLIWVPAARLPRSVASAVAIVAAASLAIYLTHWQVYPAFQDDYPWLALLSSLAVGIAVHRLASGALRRLPQRAPAGRREHRFAPSAGQGVAATG